MAQKRNKRTDLLAWIAGFTVGILWVAMALTCLVSGFRGYENNRGDWGLAWTLIGSLLLVAGLAAMIGTWWHQTRVIPRGN